MMKRFRRTVAAPKHCPKCGGSVNIANWCEACDVYGRDDERVPLSSAFVEETGSTIQLVSIGPGVVELNTWKGTPATDAEVTRTRVVLLTHDAGYVAPDPAVLITNLHAIVSEFVALAGKEHPDLNAIVEKHNLLPCFGPFRSSSLSCPEEDKA